MTMLCKLAAAAVLLASSAGGVPVFPTGSVSGAPYGMTNGTGPYAPTGTTHHGHGHVHHGHKHIHTTVTSLDYQYQTVYETVTAGSGNEGVSAVSEVAVSTPCTTASTVYETTTVNDVTVTVTVTPSTSQAGTTKAPMTSHAGLVDEPANESPAEFYPQPESSKFWGHDGHYSHGSFLPMVSSEGPVAATSSVEAPMVSSSVVESSSAYVAPIVTSSEAPIFSYPAETSTTPEATSSTVEVGFSTPEATSTAAEVSSSAPAPTSTVVEVTTSAPAPSSYYGVPVSQAPESSASAVASSAPSSGGSKRGLAYNDASLGSCFEGSRVQWGYNWGQLSSGLSSSFEYVPMLWGTSKGFPATWQESAEAAIAAGSTHLLGFNEPDGTNPDTQADMSTGEAATAFKQYMTEMFGGKAKLGSPAVTNGPAPMGIAWLEDFMGKCSGCGIDFAVVHWYGEPTDPKSFKDHVQAAHDKTGLPVWVTEFGCNSGTDDQISDFLRDVMSWMDGQEFVERYAYFMAKDGYLNTGTELSVYGRVYASG
ncbi:glycoside hydrolase family 128 protein [Aulographum hederae CBS 113979]|uniref:Glycoside hydrolase family 128 protein n=1 Tax=Aulographum hederae CBS 113979 TaxID=1176131 RepID=A0A6G1GJU0_9PEZI|nr:glycoside hydrolase family 128 protein [Aulographum hederae CBS 113979]